MTKITTWLQLWAEKNVGTKTKMKRKTTFVKKTPKLRGEWWGRNRGIASHQKRAVMTEKNGSAVITDRAVWATLWDAFLWIRVRPLGGLRGPGVGVLLLSEKLQLQSFPWTAPLYTKNLSPNFLSVARAFLAPMLCRVIEFGLNVTPVK